MPRLLAAASALAVAAGATTMTISLVATPGSWLAGYVSETGTSGMPHAIPYRCGLLLLALGVALLGLALRRPLTTPGLSAAAVLAGISGAVPCTNQCPLPPYELTTPADVVHAAATILGMLTLAATMASLWYAHERPAVRRLAALGVCLTVPLGAALGLTMLFAGRGPLAATLERLLLLEAVIWLISTAAAAAFPASTSSGPRLIHSPPQAS
ncbi:DUF998 domain-containing protein [Paractinoplanes deccanensis]|nr:DUF998 domain-containing protein [Actinoplanes deccanensis]